MRTLHLTLKKKWFDMIASGEKKEEYREIKPYWTRRFKDFLVRVQFDVVKFRNGYSPTSPTVTVECVSISFGEGRPEWGAEPGKKYFVIKLGEKIS